MDDFPTFNINPNQPGLSDVESNSTHSGLINLYIEADKAYLGLEDVELDSSHSSFFSSSYQYGISASGEDTVTLTEYMVIIDSASASIFGGTDPGAIIDSLFSSDVVLTEYIVGTDSLTIPATREPLEINGSIYIRIKQTAQVDGTVISKIQERIGLDGTIELAVKTNAMTPVASPTAVGNVFTPTVGSNGTVLYSDPATLPSVIPNDACWVVYNQNLFDTGAGFYNYANVYSWTIDVTGKTFEIEATTPVGTYDQSIEVAGFPAIVKRKLRQITQGTNNTVTKGILGTSALNKQLLFVLSGNVNMANLLPNQSLIINNPNNWTSYGDATRGIAAAAGVSVQWAIPDLPLRDLQDFNNMTAYEALESLAEGAGGKLRYLDDDTYIVLYPDQPTGTFTLPDCCFVISISEECNADVIRNAFGPGTSLKSQLPQLDPTSHTQIVDPNAQGNGNPPRQPELIHSTSKVLIQNVDPIFAKDLDSDFETIFVRTLTKSDGNGIYVVTEDSLNNLFGSDAPTEMFLLQTGFSGRYINNKDVNGELKPQLLIDFSLFPVGNAEVDAGNFITEFYMLRKSLQQAFEEAREEAAAEERINLSKTQSRYKFVPVCVIDATFVFTGAIPLEGQQFTFQYGDDYFEGIIENSRTQKSGDSVTTSITAVQWQKIDLLQRLSTLTLQIDPDNPEELLP